nr:MauE/DoxX family redox-associated membrane protein [Chryseobacterium cucumeris]
MGLIGSFVLMLIFTGYIALLLSKSKNLPCSCGGILEKMSWNQHLYFNIGCVTLSAIALGLNLKYSRPAE